MSSAPDRLIPTEDNPCRPDKSLPATPGPQPTAHPEPNTQVNGTPPSVANANNTSPKKKSGQDEKKELMERLQPPKDSKPTDMAQQKGDRWAKDPTTGGDVLIKDLEFEGTLSLTH